VPSAEGYTEKKSLRIGGLATATKVSKPSHTIPERRKRIGGEGEKIVLDRGIRKAVEAY